MALANPGACSVTDCGRIEYARTWCRMHYKRVLKHGDLAERKRRWSGDAVTYSGMHRRVASRRGPARDHDCINCGNPAQEWAYDHQDPKERRGTSNGQEVYFSLDPAHYEPRCVPCHRAFDNEHTTSQAERLLREATTKLARTPRKNDKPCRVHRYCAYRDDDPTRCPWCHASWALMPDLHTCTQPEFLDEILRKAKRLR